jgi:tripartite ATP-independent transporter DctP family solute receptor
MTSLIACFALAFSLAAHSGEKVTLKLAHHGVAGEIFTIFCDRFAERVSKETDGVVVINNFGNGQLGNVNEMLSGVQVGFIDIGLHDHASLAPFVPEMAVFNAPYIYKDAISFMKVVDPYASPVMQKLNQRLTKDGGMRVIGNCYRGARNISCKFPVYSPADLKGQKMRGVPLPVWTTMINGIGAIPTPMDFAEVPTALSTGVIVAQENPLNNIYTSKVYEVSPYISITEHMQSAQVIFINENNWQSIPAERRAVIERILRELAVESIQWEKDSSAELIKNLKANGAAIITAADGLKVEEFRESVLKQVNKDFPEWREIIAEIQAMQGL